MPDEPQSSTRPPRGQTPEAAPTAPAPARAPLWARAAVRRGVCIAGFALLALNLLEFPRHAFNETHDLSSHAAFEYYAARHFQFGQQVYQSVGPFGYVNYAYSYAGYLPVQKIVLKNLWRLGLFLLILWTNRRLPRVGLKVVWWAAFFILQPFGWPLAWPLASGPMLFQQVDWDQAYAYLAIYLAALCLLQDRKDWPFRLRSSAWLFFLAFTALTKNTAFVLAGWAVLAVILQKLLRKDFLTALGMVVSFSLSLVVLWLLAGQEPGNLPRFVWGIFHFASGYNEALMRSQPLGATLAAVVVVGLFMARSLYGWAALGPASGRGLVEVGLLGLAWKHGMVRGDFIHVSALFFAACLLAVPWLFLAIPGARLPAAASPVAKPALRAALAWAVLAATFTLTPLALFNYPECRYELRGLGTRLRSNFLWLVAPGRQMAERQQELRDAQARFALPDIKVRVGNARVDYFGYEPGYVLLNGLNYWSRPMPISFAAFNPELERANEAFYRNPLTAPEFVICAVGGVDNRATVQDDALALQAILDNYHPVLEEKRHLLLEKNEGRWGAQAERTLLAERNVRLGDIVSLDAWKDTPGLDASGNPAFPGGQAALLLFQAAPLLSRLPAGRRGRIPLHPVRHLDGNCRVPAQPLR